MGLTSFFPIAESPKEMLKCLKHNLDLRGVRPAPDDSYENLLARLLKGIIHSVSDVEPMDCPAWDLSQGTYEAAPAALAQAERAFAKIRSSPFREEDPIMDDTIVGGWDKFAKLGKPALNVFCENYKSAFELKEPSDRGDFLYNCLCYIDSHVSKMADSAEFSKLALSLRIDLACLPSADQVPIGLVKEFATLLDSMDVHTPVNDPQEWWVKHERFIPDLAGHSSTWVIDLNEL